MPLNETLLFHYWLYLLIEEYVFGLKIDFDIKTDRACIFVYLSLKDYWTQDLNIWGCKIII